MAEAVERELQQRSTGSRIFALDAMRGLAAFVVIWYHFRQSLDVGAPRWWMRPMVAGPQAVVLFFVLSGYVLSLPAWRGRQMPYGRYLVRRVFRIWVPYAAAVVLAAVVAQHYLFSRLPLTPWFRNTWQTALTPGLLLRQFAMMGHGELNTAFWSLRFEMQMSIVFPLLCWVLLRMGLWGGVGVGLAAVAVGFRMESATMIWGSCFVFGAVLAKAGGEVRRGYGRIPVAAKVACLGCVVALYFAENSFLTTMGACGALVFAEHSRARRWMDTAVPEYLGRISYSLYLTHGTVLYFLLNVLWGRVPVFALGLIFLGTSLAVAHGFCVGVEEPAMRWGRRLTAGGAGEGRNGSRRVVG